MTENNQKFNVAIIGGGPAGIMTAITATQNGSKVILIEKTNQLGKKLLITGKGRCNITNAYDNTRTFINSFGKNGKFLFTAINNFSNNDVVSFFEKLGLKTKVERGNRVFPITDKSTDVLNILINQLKKYNVTILKNTEVKDIMVEKNIIQKIKTTAGEIMADKYIICTGGLSYPETGCSGDGYKWAKKLGHKIINPSPALVPIIVKEKFIKDLEGLSLKNVTISIWQNNKKKDERFGEALFTLHGMSGPIVLDMSKNIGSLLKTDKVELQIDFKPALDYKILDQRIQKDFNANKNKAFKNSLDKLLPKKIIPIVIKLSEIGPDKKATEIKKEERKKLLKLLKEFKLVVKSIGGFEKAVVTTGGVDLKEIDPKTMRSIIIKNLYFAGEVLDLDGPTGGYNLQACWSTGHLAGESCAK